MLDECSMAYSALLDDVNSGLKSCAKGNDREEDFGNLDFFLFGDFLQLPPVSTWQVQCKPLFTDVVCHSLGQQSARINADSRIPSGMRLFKTFQKIEMVVQVRSGDATHTRDLQDFRVKPQPFSNGFIARLQNKKLVEADVRREKWRFATRLFYTNDEVQAANHAQAVRYATEHGLPVIRWLKEPCCDGTVEGVGVLATQFPHLAGTYVQGAPCMVTKNTYHGTANGTKGVAESLVFADASDADKLREGNWQPGGEIWVAQPNFIIVKRDDGTSVPIPRRDDDLIIRKWNRATRAKTTARFRSIAFLLAFAATFHKFQGQTVPVVILHIDERTTFEMLNVAISRVRSGGDIRVVFHGPNLRFLAKLRRPKDFDVWQKNFKADGTWKEDGMQAQRHEAIAKAHKTLASANKLQGLRLPQLKYLCITLDLVAAKNGMGVSNKPHYIEALTGVWLEQRQKAEAQQEP